MEESWNLKGEAKAPGPGIMSGEGEASSCSFSRGVYGSEGACAPERSTHELPDICRHKSQ